MLILGAGLLLAACQGHVSFGADQPSASPSSTPSPQAEQSTELPPTVEPPPRVSGPDSTCTLRYRDHDAYLRFNGSGSIQWCARVIAFDSNWQPVPGLAMVGYEICAGNTGEPPQIGMPDLTREAQFSVLDVGGYDYGRLGCQELIQLGLTAVMER